jgi:hypothetical protein
MSAGNDMKSALIRHSRTEANAIQAEPRPARPDAAAVLSLQRSVGNRAVARALAAAGPDERRCRVPKAGDFRTALVAAAVSGAVSRRRQPIKPPPPILQRALMSQADFVRQRVATTTIQTLIPADATLQAIADELARYANPPHGTAPLTIAQTVSALCKQWLAANPFAWVHGAAPAPGVWRGAAAPPRQPAVTNAVRSVLEGLHEDVQQELLDLAGQHAAGALGSVFKERVRPTGQGQTPAQATQTEPGRYGGAAAQQHWEGWKIHVSVPASVAGDVAASLVPQLEQEGSWYKVRKNIQEYRNVQDQSVGKFLVIYPGSVAHLEALLTRLESTLPGLVGARPSPPVQGDVQLDTGGYVWGRYGVFLDKTSKNPGSKKRWVNLRTGGQAESQYAVWDPVQGGWVDDPRNVPIPPAWGNQLTGQIQAIRAQRRLRLRQQLAAIEQAAAEARARPRAASA